MSSIVMSWSKCKIEVGATGDSDAMATELTNIGIINDKSTTLSSEDGDVLEAKATGGVVVAREEGEPTFTLTTRVKEMTFAVKQLFTGATLSTDETTLTYTTHVVGDYFSVKLTPKNIGSFGIKARKTNVSFRPGSSEEEGSYVDLTFTFLACEDNEVYSEFVVAESDWA